MRELVTEIVAGKLADGEMLPREVDLAERFDVSRGVAREAHPRARGARAGERAAREGRDRQRRASSGTCSTPTCSSALLEGTAAADVLAEYVECRRILEVEGGRTRGRARRRRTIAASEALLAQMEAAGARAEPRPRRRFHEADIGVPPGARRRDRQPRARRARRAHPRRAADRALSARPPAVPVERALPEHRRILAAVVGGRAGTGPRGDGEHLDTVGGYLREYAAPRLAAPPESAARAGRGTEA